MGKPKEKSHRFEPSVRVALREQSKRSHLEDEDILDQPSDDEVLREFGGMVDHDSD